MDNILGTRLKELREEMNKTQKDIAKIFGITNFQLSRYESGQSNPDPDLIKKFADYYQVTTDYLLGRTDNKNINTLSTPSSLKTWLRQENDDLSTEEKEELSDAMEEYFAFRKQRIIKRRKDPKGE